MPEIAIAYGMYIDITECFQHVLETLKAQGAQELVEVCVRYNGTEMYCTLDAFLTRLGFNKEE